MTRVLIILSCIKGDSLPDCGSGISQNCYANFSTCEDAVVRTQDQMRADADARGQTVLLIDTRCIVLSVGAPA